MTAQPLVIWGGTGHARVIREALRRESWHVVAVFDQREIVSPFEDVPLFVGTDTFSSWMHSQSVEVVAACVAIGGNDGKSRLDTADFLLSHGLNLPTVIHRTGFVATTATIGDGCHVLAQAAVCANARLGRSVIVNTAASVDHDCVIGDGVHIGPGARLGGEVLVEENAFIGIGAVVLPRVRIGSGAIIGAGAIVTRDVPACTTVIGNPAHPPIRK
ncbi:acetyltransferase [Luteimonas terricola]|uniref:Hexapeptide transferase n=1 Tax=Luteimonas terricola TaxID=645597 RepID=A0ABQ2EAC8_9GAMM|nr:acetyltransferase [Luteimonas terricola]GGJ99574.1 hexapeptide transferase [Luteimonas terricola]